MVVFLVALLGGTAVFSGGNAAQARPRPGSVQHQARTAYKNGKAAMEAGNYEEALAQFRTADSLHPGFAPKFRIAVCLDKLGRIEEAVQAYRAFIDARPTKKYADNVADAGAPIAELETKLPATISVNVTPANAPGLQFAVDGVVQPGPEFKVEPGQHTIAVTADGYEPATKTVVPWAGERLAITVSLAPAMAAGPPLPPGPPPGQGEPVNYYTVAGWSAIGIAGVGAAVATVLGVKALGSKSDFDETKETDKMAAEQAADDAEAAGLGCDIAWPVSVVFAATGVALLIVADEEPAEEHPGFGGTPKLVPYAGPQGGGMAATWTF